MTQDEVFEGVRAVMASGDRPAVASQDAVREVEAAIGCPLPPLLRRLFLEVANGGFGPPPGILGVRGGQRWAQHQTWTDLLDVYRAFRSGPGPHVPRPMLWLYDWGCGIWSLADCSRPDGQMWVWDPNGEEDPAPANSLFRQAMTFTEWLAAWLDGQLAGRPVVSGEVIGQRALFGGMAEGRWH